MGSGQESEEDSGENENDNGDDENQEPETGDLEDDTPNHELGQWNFGNWDWSLLCRSRKHVTQQQKISNSFSVDIKLE